MDIQEYGNGNGKGDAPRNCMSDEFREGFDAIDWGKGDKVEVYPRNEREFEQRLRREIIKTDAGVK